MILIISTENLEATSEEVIDWLDSYGVDYFRMNGEELQGTAMSFLLSDSQQQLQLENGSLEIDKVKVVWLRRFGNSQVPRLYDLDNKLSDAIAQYLRGELIVAKKGILKQLEHKIWLSRPSQGEVNKLHALNVAKECGLTIPTSLVTTSKNRLIEFIKEQEQVIIKALRTPFSYYNEETWMVQYTSKLDTEDLEKYGEKLFPVFVQQYIEKEYELRIFYFHGQCYPMAIFSQGNTQTVIDFRQYDWERPNRMVPFRLPDDLVKKIDKLMKKLDLETGSLDIIRTPEGAYVFLEVNPVGQFGMVSQPCNYFLEKKVADWLCEQNEITQ